MRMSRPVDTTLHGATDYTVGTLLMTALPRLIGVEGTPAGRPLRLAGASHVAYSTLSDYPLGIVKAIPFKVHLALDGLGALALAAVPFVTGRFTRGRREWAPNVALAAFELVALAMTDPTGKGEFHGDVEAVRRANTENPHRKIHDGGRAVTAGVA